MHLVGDRFSLPRNILAPFTAGSNEVFFFSRRGIWVYGYCAGLASSRRIAQRLHEDIAFRVLAANNTPNFRTISDFRKDNLAALSGLFLQVLALCQRAGLVKLGHVALDGTKVKANASRHKAMS